MMVSNKMTQLTKHVDCIFTNIGRELSHQNWKIRNYITLTFLIKETKLLSKLEEWEKCLSVSYES